ncbi:MAG: D-Ala-D-Ala carboxypeptidase family metallohydrolase [Pseudomonadota bacterium]
MTVIYGGYVVSDPDTREMLEKISDCLDRSVLVTSGDRSSVPKGGARDSMHLTHMAADFHVSGMTDRAAFRAIKDRGTEIFGDSMEFQLIWHGSSTQTAGPHLHLGNAAMVAHKRGFWQEGVTSKGVYQRLH